jgi:hypothetical protein
MKVYFQGDLKPGWARCYHHNFLRFLPIFGENFGVVQKINVVFAKTAVFRTKTPIFSPNFWAKLF